MPTILALDEARQKGGLILSSIVVAEIAGHFSSATVQEQTLCEMGVRLVDFTFQDTHLAGVTYQAYNA